MNRRGNLQFNRVAVTAFVICRAGWIPFERDDEEPGAAVDRDIHRTCICCLPSR